MPEKPWSELFEFEQPPVVETILAVRFRDISWLGAPEIYDFWNKYLRKKSGKHFPLVQVHPAYEMPIEMFGDPGRQSGAPVQLNFGIFPPPLRHWFVSEDDKELVQLQNNWVAVNWRRQPNTEYPRYERVLEMFKEVWANLDGFVSGLSEKAPQALVPVQCEVVYINHIFQDQESPDAVWANLDDTTTVTSLAGSANLPARMDGLNANYSFLVDDDKGQPFARLRVQLNSAISRDEKRDLAVMNLTFRGRPPTPDIDGVLDLFDSAHNWIVGSFDGLTTEKMHEKWGRRPRGAAK